ncbi:hypothetical protein OH491_19960 [Termitidicoccus mucosus]|uniref:hypothetical protein n=1 Tax=Termitidicoccus mucosus TaxID=1184151 RepID=UPI0011AB6627
MDFWSGSFAGEISVLAEWRKEKINERSRSKSKTKKPRRPMRFSDSQNAGASARGAVAQT